MNRLLAFLLHLANSRSGKFGEFYELKDRLCRRYATFRGHELQEIRKECWGPRVWSDEPICYEDFRYSGCQGKKCPRCGGTGIFDIRWIRLERWEWAGYVFHRPSGDTRVPPELGTRISIIGRIKHRDYGHAADEAYLWLLVLCGEWRMFWRELRGVIHYGRYIWPLLTMQRLIAPVAWRVGSRKCIYCERRFWHLGSGWQICRKCRRAERRLFDEVPF